MKNKSIYMISANPALDLSGHVDRIIPNEKNYVFRAREDAGGNAINAARISKRLGGAPILLGFLGGATGEKIKLFLKREKVESKFTRISGTTRTNISVTNETDHFQTRLAFPSPHIKSSEIKSFFRALKRIKAPGIAVVGGSLPDGCARSFYPDLIRKLDKMGLSVIIDVPMKELKSILSAKISKVLMIKPNQVEFEALIGKKMKSETAIATAALRLSKKVEIVCVSLGNQGAVIAWNKQAWLIKGPQVHSRGTVGAGDSMVGAIATSFQKDELFTHSELPIASDLILDAFKWGTAAGAATATTEGTSLGKAALVRSLYPKCTIKRIF